MIEVFAEYGGELQSGFAHVNQNEKIHALGIYCYFCSATAGL